MSFQSRAIGLWVVLRAQSSITSMGRQTCTARSHLPRSRRLRVINGFMPRSYTRYGVSADSLFRFSNHLRADIGYGFIRRDLGLAVGVAVGVGWAPASNGCG